MATSLGETCSTSKYYPPPFLGADKRVALLDSHYDTNGDKPYHRLFRAGCREHVMENIWGQDGEVRTTGSLITYSRAVYEVGAALTTGWLVHHYYSRLV